MSYPMKPYDMPIEDGDWQHVIAYRLAEIRNMPGPTGIEFYEAAEAGAALDDAGFLLSRKTQS